MSFRHLRTGSALRPLRVSAAGALRSAAALAGLGVALWLVWAVGPATLAAEMRRLSWRLGVLMLPQGLVTILDAAGWRYSFPGRLPRLAPLIGARLAGEAVNDTTPTGTVGGEPLKAWLVARGHGLPLEEAMASVVIAKTAFVAAQVAFLGLGLAFAAGHLHPAPALTRFLAALLGVGGAAGGGFIWAQQLGLFTRSRRALAWLGVGSAGGLVGIDRSLRAFYRGRPGRFTLAVAFHFLGWVAGSLEVWLALRFLGHSVDLATALVIEALATGIRSASFLVPASIGVQEGSLVAIFAGFGLGAGAGLAFGLVRRLREAVWAAAGYVVLAAWPGPRPGVSRGRGIS